MFPAFLSRLRRPRTPYLFFDTETDGLPSPRHPFPRLVQLAWILGDADGAVIDEASVLVRPEGFSIPFDAVEIHGITTERALAEGIPLADALSAFAAAAARAASVVCHNAEFDCRVVAGECRRLARPDPLRRLPRVCTMKGSTAYCRLPGRHGWKWPRLSELHRILFGTGFDGAHDAAVDVRATMRCFHALRRRKVFP
jgi:DNA polymerase III epsilon subunit-like protein